MNINCPFCELSDPIEEVVFENELALFTRNIKYQGALKYSGVIIPKKHKETLFDLDIDEIKAIHQILTQVKLWMDANYQPDGYTIGWNCNATGGQTIMHAHMHVIPRFKDEPLAGQ